MCIRDNGEPRIYFEVLSPITGTVTKRHVAMGDYVKEGSALFEVVDLSNVWVMFDGYESDLPWIKKNDTVMFTIQSVPGRKYSGRVTYIEPFIDARTRVAQIRVELDNKSRQLKPEMFANGILKSTADAQGNELLIPKSAVLWTGKRAVVYVKVPERETASFIYREIVLGPEAGNFYVVADGLFEGEEIATNGVFKIDAAAQLAGKQSMMNPNGGTTLHVHDHGEMTHSIVNDTAIVGVPMEMSHDANLRHEMFLVSGSCGMCEQRIETTVKALDGVNDADWNQETKMLHVSFNSDKVVLGDIHKAIAKAGHDTELESAPKDVYDNLPACCQYSRE